MQTASAEPAYTPKVKNPHRLQTLRIRRKNLYKAYGLAVSRQLASAQGKASVSTKQGAGAVFISRKFPVTCLDDNKVNMAKRIESDTETASNRGIRSETLVKLLMKYDEANPDDGLQLAKIINWMIVRCGYAQTVKKVEPLTEQPATKIVDIFPIREKDKSYTKDVTFDASAFWTRVIEFENGYRFRLLFAQDSTNSDMFLLRLSPVKITETLHDVIYESLVIMNKFRKLEVDLVKKLFDSPSVPIAALTSIEAKAGDFVRNRRALMEELQAVEHNNLEHTTRRLNVARTEATVGDLYHPTYAFLRLKVPLTRYLPSASSVEAQTEESIPFLTQVLRDLTTVHWVYAGLRAVAAVMVLELENTAPNNWEDAYAETQTKVDQFLSRVLFDAADATTVFPRTIAQQTPEEMLQTTALAADLVSALYKKFTERVREDPEKRKIYKRQLMNLYVEGTFSPAMESPPSAHYGHRIAVKLYNSAPIVAKVGGGKANQTSNPGNPILLSIKRTTPWKTAVDSASTWNAVTRFKLHRYHNFNLCKWISEPANMQLPAWMNTYRTALINPGWKPVVASWMNVPRDPLKIEDRSKPRPNSYDMSKVIPVSLKIDQEIRFQVHSYLKRISGAVVPKSV
jgi:hypothetical protein